MKSCTFCGGGHDRSKCPWPTADDVTRARLALSEYDASYRAGGELDYPHWADEVLAALAWRERVAA